MPKTGTSFVRDCLRKIHQRKRYEIWKRGNGYKELMLPKVYAEFEPYKKNIDQHGTYIQIPSRFKGREVVSIIRNPFEKIISVYEFGFWKNHPIYDEKIIKAAFPTYPNLSFDKFVDFYHDFWMRFLIGNKARTVDIGPQTLLHIKFYNKTPSEIIEKLEYVQPSLKDDSFAKIKFLRTESLNSDLYSFLAQRNYSKQKIEFIKEATPLNTSKRSIQEYITPSIREKILYKERLLFDAFPEYKKTYKY